MRTKYARSLLNIWESKIGRRAFVCYNSMLSLSWQLSVYQNDCLANLLISVASMNYRKRLARPKTPPKDKSRRSRTNWSRRTPTLIISGKMRSSQPPPKPKLKKRTELEALTTFLRWRTMSKTDPSTAPSASTNPAGASTASSVTTPSKRSRPSSLQPSHSAGGSPMTTWLSATPAAACASAPSSTRVISESINEQWLLCVEQTLHDWVTEEEEVNKTR